VLWGLINCLPTAVFAGVAWSFSENDLLQSEDTTAIAVWLMVTIGVFAIIFAINSSIHSFLVLKYAKEDKLATSVGFYYMSNAVGRLVGTLGSGVIYTYTGDDLGPYAGTDALRGMAACFIAGTVCAFIAALITFRIRDDKAGLRCGPWVCVGTREDAQEPAAAPEAPAPAAAPDTASEATDANGGSAQAHECAARAGAPLSELSGAAQLEVSEVVVVRTS
jgi:F0F1-type ATP synthase assembly protein I